MAFHQDKSSTYKETKQTAAIEFGSGSLKGNFVTDDIRIGGCEASAGGLIHVKDQKFGNTHEASTIFSGSNFEAIVGMAYPELAEPGVTPLFDSMMHEKLLVSNLFAFFMLEMSEEDEKGWKPELTLGFYDKSKFVGELDWHDVKLKYMFGVQLDDIKVNGKALNVCSKLQNPK